MAINYGTDVAALTDLPDPEVLISGPLVVAYRVCRRRLTQSGALAEIGDEAPYSSFDVRDYLGSRGVPGVERTIEQLCGQGAAEDPAVLASSDVAAFVDGGLSIKTTLGLSDGSTFPFVFSVTDAGFASITQG